MKNKECIDLILKLLQGIPDIPEVGETSKKEYKNIFKKQILLIKIIVLNY